MGNFIMKMAILTIVILISIHTFPQPFLGLAAINRGACAQIGVLAHEVALTAAYSVPFIHADVPAIFSVSTGKLFFITRRDKDNYSVSTSIGVAYYRVKDFTDYYAGTEQIKQVSEIRPIYNLEFGKDAYMGRIFISANYCKDFYFGIGMKVFAYRIKN